MSKTSKTQMKPRNALIATVALGLLAGVLGFSVGTVAPARAAEPSANQYGYMKVYNPAEYMSYYVARDWKVLYVDTEHADDEGFWFAQKTQGGTERGFRWYHQSWGKWCVTSQTRVVWNQWLNVHTCEIDPALVAEDYPGWSDATAACRVSTGYPWKQAGFSQAGCENVVLELTYDPITQRSATGQTCAPWEDQGLTPQGSAKCIQQTYPWQNRTPNTEEVFWAAAPDTCTGMPADSNRRVPAYDPNDYAPVSGGDGTCTGSVAAPNCATAPAIVRTTYQACTGVAPPPPTGTEEPTDPVEPGTFTGTATSTKTATVTVPVTVTRTVLATATVWSDKVQVKRKKGGKTFKAKAPATVVRSTSKSATVAGQQSGSATSTASRSCTGASQAEADSCAQTKADEAALADATAKAQQSARATGEMVFGDQAQAQARNQVNAVIAAPATAAEIATAKAQAKAVAVKKVKKKIKKAKR